MRPSSCFVLSVSFYHICPLEYLQYPPPPKVRWCHQVTQLQSKQRTQITVHATDSSSYKEERLLAGGALGRGRGSTVLSMTTCTMCSHKEVSFPKWFHAVQVSSTPFRMSLPSRNAKICNKSWFDRIKDVNDYVITYLTKESNRNKEATSCGIVCTKLSCSSIASLRFPLCLLRCLYYVDIKIKLFEESMEPIVIRHLSSICDSSRMGETASRRGGNLLVL